MVVHVEEGSESLERGKSHGIMAPTRSLAQFLDHCLDRFPAIKD